jgi:phosphoribosyl 1,2-cyclic phosphate phosphodiesterase
VSELSNPQLAHASCSLRFRYHFSMIDSRTFIFLGTGTSVGVPMLGCECAVCTSTQLRNHRTRSSVLLQLPRGNLLIDTSPELRLQLLREKIPLAHAVLYTHYHADHLFGLDDVRLFPVRLGHPLPLYCTADVEEVIRTCFSYAFTKENAAAPAGFVPKLEFHRIGTESLEILGETITPIPLIHGRFDVLGYRIGDVAYCTDVSKIPEASLDKLRGLDVLVLDALRPDRPHSSHLSLQEALAIIAELQPKQAYLTHMSHEMDYDVLVKELPAGVQPAYDGLRFSF